ncbi:hypothetical protein AB6A40_007263 [Gnathostoma spinigerum]|uniref:Phosphoserine aminotransferase n=1 Tax=Gnathostoma spinigerum TaxID=75299 RepID=A0ABD6ETD4_9BILA
MKSKVINYGAGPAKIPEEVMAKARDEFLEYAGTGVSVLEMSHRSVDFTSMKMETEKLLREQMSIPDEFDVLFMQGGGSGQFAAIPLNLKGNKSSADYAVTGAWSAKAASEATKYLTVNEVFKPTKPYVTIPEYSTWQRSDEAAYLYYCHNETVHGIEFHNPPETFANVPLVADVSSDILSGPFSFKNHGVVFAGTQKNLGMAGLTILIVRKDLLGKESQMTPSVMNYNVMAMNKSNYNTPCVYGIYLTKLILEWIRDLGGVHTLYERNMAKSSYIYNIIDSSNGFYTCPVDKKYRSIMNIPFRIGGTAANEELEKKFLVGAIDRGMIGLKGHRSVGGIRASLYNAITIKEATQLGDYMLEFMEER